MFQIAARLCLTAPTCKEPSAAERRGARMTKQGQLETLGEADTIKRKASLKIIKILAGVTRGVERIQWVRNQSSNGQSSSHNFRSCSS